MTTPTTPDFIRLLDSEDTGSTSCFFDAAAPTTADVVASLGHEPNGYFWEGVVRRLWIVLGVVEGLNPWKDEDHARTQEVPR